MFHTVTLCGRVGQAPDVKVTKSGLKMATFSMAIDIKGKDKKVTIWPKVTAFGSLSDIVEKYTQKGSLVIVEGRLSPDPVTGAPKIFSKKDGSQAASYDIVAEKVQVLQKQESMGFNGGDPIDDIPF